MRISLSRRSILIALAVLVILLVVGFVWLGNVANDIIMEAVSRGDCTWGSRVQVWHDADRDGLRDEDETPLANVAVYADDTRNDIIKVANAVSDTDGIAALSVFIAGCPETAFEVYASAPPSFCPTTPERLAKPPHQFGFAACPAPGS
jgi:hypothetical protein